MYESGSRDELGRPFVGALFTSLVRSIARAGPDGLGPIDADRVLVVAGAARGESTASIRPLAFGLETRDPCVPLLRAGGWNKPRIELGGVPMLYEICLRPRFFLTLAPEERLSTLIHELWHISPSFDGTLAEERRHDRMAKDQIDREVERIAKSFRENVGASSRLDPLEIRGEIRIDAWLSRPPTRIPSAASVRATYTERDLYSAIVEQR